MILRLHPEQNLHWVTAFGLSAVAHAGAFVMMFDLWPGASSPTTIPLMAPDISVSTVILDDTALGAVDTSGANLEPETLSADESDPQTLAPTEPEPERTISPERVQPTAPVDAARLNPIRPDDGTTLQGIAPIAVAPERLATITSDTQSAAQQRPPTLAPVNTPTLAPPPAPRIDPITPEETALNELIQKIRDHLGDPCLVALPQRQSGGDPLVVVVAAQDRAINTFAQTVLNDADAPVEHSSVLIDTRQCPAVNLARESTNYPSFRLAMNLRTPIVSSGGRLVGTIDNVAGMYTSLLLIDDNGVVQDLRRFTNFVSGRAEFDVPVSRAGAARDTSQLLFAVATQSRPNTISQRAGQLAENFFPALQAELGSDAIIAMVPFEVR